MVEESVCGGKGCMLYVLSVDISHIKEDVAEVKKAQTELMNILSEQKSILTQMNNLQHEFNRFRDMQETRLTKIEEDRKDQKEVVDGRIDKIIETRVTKTDFKTYLGITTVIIVVLTFIFNFAMK